MKKERQGQLRKSAGVIAMQVLERSADAIDLDGVVFSDEEDDFVRDILRQIAHRAKDPL